MTWMQRKARVDRMHEELGMTLGQIGAALGVSRTTVESWRRGREDDPPLCPDCENPMIEPAERCGMCAIERELGLVPA